MAEPLSRVEAAEVLRTVGHAARTRASSPLPGDVASDRAVYARRAAACEAGAAALERVVELEALIRQYEAMLADQGSGAATQHHWKRTASRLMREKHELQRIADAARGVWESQNALEPTPRQIREQEWTVVEVGRDAMADLGGALHPAALGEVELPEPPGECPRCAQPDMLMGYPSSGEWVCANCGWQSGTDQPTVLRGGEPS
jgi:hypothetical protein